MNEPATFHLPAREEGRWTARAGQELVGRAVEYGRLGKVGEVARCVPVDAGRALRVHVRLDRSLTNPDPRKFSLSDDEKRRPAKADE